MIEFENANDDSIFKKGTKQYRNLSPRIEHGFGQILDWAWVRSDHPNDTVLLNGFGGAVTARGYAVICGRDASLRDDVERKRFMRRRESVKVEGLAALVLTYDGMVVAMENDLDVAKSWSYTGPVAQTNTP